MEDSYPVYRYVLRAKSHGVVRWELKEKTVMSKALRGGKW
jgi:hypothetical protein